MNSRKINLRVLLLGIMASIIITLPGCKDDDSLADKLVGKWNTTGSFEKQNGEWVNILREGDECSYDIRPDGTVTGYQRSGGRERTAEMTWSVDEETSTFSLHGDGTSFSVKIVFDNDDQFSMYYTTNYDVSPENPRSGEFKDVNVREGR